METTVAGFHFFSNFDSGNLQKVEFEDKESEDELNSEEPDTSPVRKRRNSTPARGKRRKSSCRTRTKNDISVGSTTTLDPTDFSFKLWTRPDCFGTEFENQNRTWFFFGIRGGPQVNFGPSKVLKFTMMNLNKQAKVFSQGMSPIMLTAPFNGQLPSYHSAPNGGWERIKERPQFSASSEECNNFILSFRVLYEPNTTLYIAFTYPYSYKDLQGFLGRLERKHSGLNDRPSNVVSKMPPSSIFFHRENVCYSLERRRIDLLTVSGPNGILPEREERFKNLFPDMNENTEGGRQVLRPYKFAAWKKTIFISARVHPGETQSSFVMNGFLRFILRESDPRSVALRKKYVFKLIPMLNPDGVVNGQYRTDLRGVNLNRVYARPDFLLHPQIYAARKLILYAHLRENFCDDQNEADKAIEKKPDDLAQDDDRAKLELSFQSIKKIQNDETDSFLESSSNNSVLSNNLATSAICLPGLSSTPIKSGLSHVAQFGYEMTETSRCSEGDESIADFSERMSVGANPSSQRTRMTFGLTSFEGALAKAARARCLSFGKDDICSPFSSKSSKRESFSEARCDADDDVNTFRDPLEINKPFLSEIIPLEENANLDFVRQIVRPNSTSYEIKMGDNAEKPKQEEQEKNDGSNDSLVRREAPPWDPRSSGLSMYVDIHGHASKRGIFMYGNHFQDLETQTHCMLIPKLMSINCANFDFPACIFTEKNMYLKDRHTGAGREGSGRVSVYKLTGLIHSYTLECNFNTGRFVNGIPMASRDAGRATPPPPPHPLPQTHPGTGSTPNSTLQDQVPPKYTPEIYEDAGKALAVTILDMTDSNPWTRLTCSACKNLRGVRDWLRKHIRAAEAAISESNNEKDGRGRSGRRKSKSSTRVPNPPDPQLETCPNTTRSLRSSICRVRTVSSSASVMKSLKKVPQSPGSYQPQSKITRKNSVQSTSSASRALDFLSSEVNKSIVSTSHISAGSPKSACDTPKKKVSRRKSLLRKRSSDRKGRSSQQSSRPTSPQRQPRPGSPKSALSPSSPVSPLSFRRATSMVSIKRPRSRPNSPPSRSAGPSSPHPSRSNSAASQSSLKRLTPKRLNKKLGKHRRGTAQSAKPSRPSSPSGSQTQAETSEASGLDSGEPTISKDPELPSPGTPKKKQKVQQLKKKKKISRQHRAKIIISAAAGFNPSVF